MPESIPPVFLATAIEVAMHAGRVQMAHFGADDLQVDKKGTIDLVQTVGDSICGEFGFDEDTAHWINVAIRESVINAIKHGNKNDPTKKVIVEFSPVPGAASDEMVIRIEDQGEGFVPEEVADPLAPENMLKSSGRGIFFMRSFMDDVQLQRAPEGGMEVRMMKKLGAGG